MNFEESSISLTTKDGKTFACRINPDVVTLADGYNTVRAPHDVFRNFYHLFSLCKGQDKDAIKQLKKDTLKDTIAKEILALVEGEGEIGSYDLLTQLVAKPAFEDEARANGLPLTSFVQEVESAFRSPVEIDGYRIALVRKKVKGSNVRKWFEVTALQ